MVKHYIIMLDGGYAWKLKENGSSGIGISYLIIKD
jgi:hypothetical protein